MPRPSAPRPHRPRRPRAAAWIAALAGLAFALWASPARGQGLVVGSTSAAAGEEAVVPVASSGAEVAHLQLDVAFDPAVVTPSSVAAGAALDGHLVDWEVVAPGVLRIVVWSATCPAGAAGALERSTGRATFGDGEVVRIAWQVDPSAAPGVTALEPSGAVLSDAAGTAVPASLGPGAVEVTGGALAAEIPTLGEWGLVGLVVLLLGAGLWVLRRGAAAGIAAALIWLMSGQPVLAQLPRRAAPEPAVDSLPAAPPGPRLDRLAAAAAGGPGDADGDGAVTASDLTPIVDQLLARGPAAGDPDCNGDGAVDVLDLACVLAAACADGPPDNLPPTLAPIADASLREGEVYTAQPSASDPDAGDTLTFSLVAAPVGMVVDPQTGSLLWVPRGEQAGTATARLRVTDEGGLFAERQFTLAVRRLGSPPSLAAIADRETTAGTPIALAAAASDPDLPDDTLAFSLLLAPAGMTIDATSGQISWTPGSPQVGGHDVTVQVADQEGLLDFTHFVVSVRAVNRAPVARDDAYEARLGVPLAIAAPGLLGNDEDADGDPLIAALDTDVGDGVLTLAADGSFEYLLEPPDRTTPVELELLCQRRIADGSHTQTNGTVAVGDVDGDGDVELVGAGGFSGATFISEFWILNAADCSVEFVGGASIEQAGGFLGEEQLGLLDIDGDGDLEIIGPRERYPLAEGGNFDDEHLHAFHHDGTLAWASETSPLIDDGGQTNWGAAGPTFADLDADGTPEIVMAFSRGFSFNTFSGAVAYDATDGSLEWEFLSTFRQGDHNAVKVPYVADLDLDGTMEVIVHNSVLDHAGQLLFELPSRESVGTSAVPQLALAIANFDDDPFPELFGRDDRYHYLFEHDGTLAWRQELRNTARGYMTAADFDGDGAVEVAYVTCVSESDFGCSPSYLAVYDVGNAGSSLVWSHEDEPTLAMDSFYNNRSVVTAFDANRDGAFDLVLRHDVNDTVYVIDGRDGSILASAPAPDYSGQHRFVTVADLDLDGHAELVTSYTGGIEGSTAVWKGTAEHPLPAAPAYRSHWLFQEASFAADGVLATNPVPRWLQPGRNGQYLITPEPDPLVGTTQTFTYVANDGALDSAPASVVLDVLPPGNPPRFLTEPDTLTTRGMEYRYAPIVVDPDLGDTVSFRLTAAPDGTTIDPATGEVRWQPDTNGDFEVSILATDTIGFATPQAYTLTVGEPVIVPDVVGEAQADAEAALAAANLLVGRTRTATAPSTPAGAVAAQSPSGGSVAELGAAVDLVVSLGPAPEDVDDDADGFSENEGDCDDGNGSVHPGAADPAGDGVDQDCDGFDGSEPPVEIVVEPAALHLLAGEARQLAAYAIFADGTSQIATASVAWGTSNMATATVSASGRVTAVADAGPATITATRGAVVGTVDVAVVAAEPADDDAPAAEIATPADGESVFGPVEILGTADDPQLVRYELAIARAGEESFTVVAVGTSPVIGGVLGELDPTLMPNGLHTLRLTVLDAGGNQVADEVDVVVDGGNKPGRFSLAFQDLRVDLGGLPIEIERTYDSVDRSRGDFGFGWRSTTHSYVVTCSELLGSGWTVLRSGFAYGLVPTRSHRCSVRHPDGVVADFELVPSPAISAIVPFSFLQATFRPRQGTLGSLRPLDNPNLLIAATQPGPVDLLDDTTLEVFAPQRFLYTTPQGLEVTISISGGVERVRDRNGNTLTFDANGISHSAGAGVVFERDAAGRIVAITDPTGAVQRYEYGTAGDLIAHVDRGGAVTRFRYDHRHLLLEIDDPLGRSPLRNEYDEDGRLIASTDADGHRIEYERSLAARQEIRRDARGQTVFEYDELGRITARVDPLGGRWEVAYDAFGNPVEQRDPLGRQLTRSFDDDGRLVEEIDFDGNVTRFEHDERGQPVRRIDPEGGVTASSYDDRGNLVVRILPDGSERHLAWDSRGNLVASSDGDGRTTRYEYDALGRLRRTVDPAGAETDYAFDANGRLLAETRVRTLPGGGQQDLTTSYEHDARDRLVAAIDPLGNRVDALHDERGLELRRVDPLGATTEYAYDGRGNLVELAFDDGSEERYGYDAAGREVSNTDRDGYTVAVEYDPADRVTALVSPGGGTVRQTYDLAGRLRTRTDARDNTTTYSYLPGVQRIEDPLGQVTEHRFDGNGLRIARVDALGRETRFEKDSLDQVLRTLFPDGSEVVTDRSPSGRPLAVTDQLGSTTRFEYDARDRLSAVTDPEGGVTRYAHDEVGNLITVTDALGRTTRRDYDALGRVVRRILPLGQTETFEYDAGGLLAAHVDFNGRETRFEYDPDGNLVARRFADGSETTFEHTPGSRRTRAGGQTATYDAAGRLATATDPLGRQLAYAYDAADNVTSIAGPYGTTALAYDALDRLHAVAAPDGSMTTYAYDAVGNLAAVEHSNGLRTDFTYDLLDRLVEAEVTGPAGLLAEYRYTLDGKGRRVRLEESGGATPGRTVEYVYDGADRLVAERIDAPGASPLDRTVDYVLDAVGNRRAMIVSDATGERRVDSEYDANDRLVREVETFTPVAPPSSPVTVSDTRMAYDANGDLLRRDRNGVADVFQWDLEGRLVGAELRIGRSSPSVQSFTYDADGNRLRSVVDGVVTEYLVDTNRDLPVVLAEVRAGQVTRYTHGLEAISQSGPDGMRWYLYDGSMSVRALVDPAGAVTDTYTYDAWGLDLASSGATRNPYRYRGEQLDPELGLYYLRARYYDPARGVFLGQDPEAGSPFDPRTLHRYLYAGADPVQNVDPSGRSFLPEITIANAIKVGVLAGIAAGGFSYAYSQNLVLSISIGVAVAVLVGALFYGVAPGSLFNRSPKIAREIVTGIRQQLHRLARQDLKGLSGEALKRQVQANLEAMRSTASSLLRHNLKKFPKAARCRILKLAADFAVVEVPTFMIVDNGYVVLGEGARATFRACQKAIGEAIDAVSKAWKC